MTLQLQGDLFVSNAILLLMFLPFLGIPQKCSRSGNISNRTLGHNILDDVHNVMNVLFGILNWIPKNLAYINILDSVFLLNINMILLLFIINLYLFVVSSHSFCVIICIFCLHRMSTV